MGKKEKLQKELDFLLEKLRFWRYVILGIASGAFGILIGASQGVKFNMAIIPILITGFTIAIISVTRISSITKEYRKILELLEKEE